jgi:hypothetical protein
MYRFQSAPAARRDTEAELQHELDRLREQHAVLLDYREATRHILANLVLNPFSDLDELRNDARAALALARRGNPVVVRIGR